MQQRFQMIPQHLLELKKSFRIVSPKGKMGEPLYSLYWLIIWYTLFQEGDMSLDKAGRNSLRAVWLRGWDDTADSTEWNNALVLKEKSRQCITASTAVISTKSLSAKNIPGGYLLPSEPLILSHEWWVQIFSEFWYEKCKPQHIYMYIYVLIKQYSKCLKTNKILSQ